MRTVVILSFVALTAVVGILLRRDACRHETPPCQNHSASADTNGTGTSSYGPSPLTPSKGVASDPTTTGQNRSTTTASPGGTATAKPTAPPPSPMRASLLRHFTAWEAEQLEAICVDSANQTVAELRAKVIDAVGSDGLQRLLDAAAPPPGIKDNTDEMVQYVLSNPPLLWWNRLKE